MRNKIIFLLLCAGLVFIATHAFAQEMDSTAIADTSMARDSSVDNTDSDDENSQTLKDEFETNTAFMVASIIAFVIFLGWLVLIILYYIWAIKKYVDNYGLSDHEWKVLYPEIYCSDADNKEEFKTIRDTLVKNRQSKILAETGDAEEAQAVTTPFDEPKENPYTKDSFGLPPGTIRGTLALTALVMFLLIEGVNLFSSTNLELHFDGLITALKMVLAFYFGSRAVEALKLTEPNRPKADESVKKNFKLKKVTKTVFKEEELPNEKPAMAARQSAERAMHIIESKPTTDSASQKKDDIKKAPLPQRVLSLTASFETSRGFPYCFAAVTGNFDDQGISYGALQWNIGQQSLQPLFRKMHTRHDDVLKAVLGRYYDDFIDMLNQPFERQMEWAKSIQIRTTSSSRTTWRVMPEWRDILNALGLTREMIAIQVEAATARYNVALANCQEFNLTSERAAALMFDINVQNGRIDVKNVKQNILDDYGKLSADLPSDTLELERMKIIAQRRSEASHYKWRQDVLSRKMTIAEGRGTVHGKEYELEKEFNITLKPLA